MDTIKILLGVTIALLLGALAISWKDFRHQERNAPKEKLAEVQRQIDEIRREQERLRLERERITLGEPAVPRQADPEVATAAPAVPESSFSAAEAAPAPVPMPEFADPTELDLSPAAPSEEELNQRAAKISGAPVVAKIAEWISNPDIGSFATLEVVDPAAVSKGTRLCLRRNTGILGRLEVNEVTEGGAIAAAVSQFGELQPEPGDELILESAVE